MYEKGSGGQCPPYETKNIPLKGDEVLKNKYNEF